VCADPEVPHLIAEEAAMARSDIDALNATFGQGLEKGDADIVASVYAPDAKILPPGSPMLTGPDIRTYWQGAIDSGMTGGTLETLAFEELGDVALEEGQFEVRVGEEVVDTGKYVVVHRRQPDGSWKYSTDIWNSSRSD
jgi:ketosteroid isomerase-like protein